ncbi:GntR family transcriptional regulator [Rhizobium sp. XQZ8]|uniref:GntR family transcriptional regulator n=1 Tax=Rhizobium populisoli TaxID=2859785 RepID=UPI001C66E5B3|nr:GntR family transcriptional regulator [Rhizobium populisoli]MBW6422891.1 GntR family transcriptional regulator [Rhizobium populisoli]
MNVQDLVEPQDETSSGPIERIVRSLEEEIVLGRLRPRERLLEEELAKHFDAKRHVIRAALAELEALGIVVRQPNKGAAVRDFSPQEVEQIYDVRALLEGHAAEIIPLPGSPELLGRLKAIHERHSQAVDAHEPRTVFRANLEFHRVLFGACGNPYLAEQINQLASRAHAIRFHAISDEKLVNRAREEHGRMIEYLERGDREKLVEVVAAHIQPSKEAYLRLSSQWAQRFR